MLTFLALGAAIGFVAGMSPGPVLTLVIAETLRYGWLRGAAVAAGPLLADGPIILLALFVLGQLPRGVVLAISIFGGAFLLYVAANIFLASRRSRPLPEQRLAARGGLLKGLVARGLSPHPYLFWFLVGAPILLEAGLSGWWFPSAFLLGYYGAIVGSNVALALTLHRWATLLSDRAYRFILLLSSAILAAYGLVLLARGWAETTGP